MCSLSSATKLHCELGLVLSPLWASTFCIRSSLRKPSSMDPYSFKIGQVQAHLLNALSSTNIVDCLINVNPCGEEVTWVIGKSNWADRSSHVIQDFGLPTASFLPYYWLFASTVPCPGTHQYHTTGQREGGPISTIHCLLVTSGLPPPIISQPPEL